MHISILLSKATLLPAQDLTRAMSELSRRRLWAQAPEGSLASRNTTRAPWRSWAHFPLGLNSTRYSSHHTVNFQTKNL